MDRRSFLASSAAIGTSIFAGCLGGNDDNSDPPETDNPPTENEEITQREPTPTPTETEPTSDATVIEETPDQTATPDDSTTPRDTQTPSGTETPSDTPRPPGYEEHVVKVGPNGDPKYSPESLTISAGDTVRWEWESDDHNIVTVAEGDEWDGTPGAGDDLYSTGYTSEYTFYRTGTYDYFCGRHDGMYAEIVVTE